MSGFSAAPSNQGR